MTKAVKERINRILNRHCVMEAGEFFKAEYDPYGDILSLTKYAELPLYFSHHLHRYNPYIGLSVGDLAVENGKTMPMAVLPYTVPPDVCRGDIIRINSKQYSVSFCEDIKGYYLLLSLTERGVGYD